jgi:hypothetical protein
MLRTGATVQFWGTMSVGYRTSGGRTLEVHEVTLALNGFNPERWRLLVRGYGSIVILKNLEKVHYGDEFEGLNHHFGGFYQLDRSSALLHSCEASDEYANAAGIHNRYFFSIQNNLGLVSLEKLIEQLLKAVGGDAKFEVSAELNYLGIALLPYANVQDRSS